MLYPKMDIITYTVKEGNKKPERYKRGGVVKAKQLIRKTRTFFFSFTFYSHFLSLAFWLPFLRAELLKE